MRAILAWGVCVVSLALMAGGGALIAMSAGPEGPDDSPLAALLVVPFTAFPIVGALIASRRRNVVGWTLLIIGLSFAATIFAESYARYALLTAPGSLPFGQTIGWVSAWIWAAYVLGIPVLLLLFPDGRLPSQRWRPVLWAAIGGVILVMVASAFRPAEIMVGDELAVANPYALEGPLGDVLAVVTVATPAVSLVFLTAAAAVVVRFRRSAGVERQQMKLFSYSAALLAVMVVVLIATDALDVGSAWEDVIWLGFIMSFALVPLAIGVAVLRYRLYDIDVLINRTLVYGAVSATLAVTYFAGLVLLQRVFSPLTQGSEISIALSTLAVAALFQPVRTRAQRFVDRRFYRHRYDASKTIDAFAARLRQEVDLDEMSEELVSVVRQTVQPAHVSLWLREVRR